MNCLRLIYDLLFVYCRAIRVKGKVCWTLSIIGALFFLREFLTEKSRRLGYPKNFLISLQHQPRLRKLIDSAGASPQSLVDFAKQKQTCECKSISHAKVIPDANLRACLISFPLQRRGERDSRASVIITRLHLRNKRSNIYGGHSSRARARLLRAPSKSVDS